MRLRPNGILITVDGGPRDLDELCALALEAVVGPDARIARRAAFTLGCCGVPTIDAWLEGRLGTDTQVVPGLAAAFLCGFEPADPAALGAALLAAFHDHPSERLVLGAALRELFARDDAPAWFAEPLALCDAHPEDWTWFAAVAPERLAAELAARLGARLGEGPSVARRGLLACFARSALVLDAKLADDLAAAVQAGRFPDDEAGNRELAHALDALTRAGRRVTTPGTALGESYGRGRLWARHLAGPARLDVLAAATALSPALFALCLEPAREPFGTWALCEVPEGGRRHGGRALDADQGFLLDLCFPRLEQDQGRGRGHWEPIYACFDRLVGDLAAGRGKGIEGRDRALAEALASLLLTLPRGPDDRTQAAWLGEWIAGEDSRSVGLAAGATCIRQRSHWLPAIGDELTRRLDSLSAVMLRGRLLEGARGRPRGYGRAPVDPGDPLLAWPRTPDERPR
ncbi:MAG: hypothetical protein R3F30_10680 [Planctomycetota bacterium]